MPSGVDARRSESSSPKPRRSRAGQPQRREGTRFGKPSKSSERQKALAGAFRSPCRSGKCDLPSVQPRCNDGYGDQSTKAESMISTGYQIRRLFCAGVAAVAIGGAGLAEASAASAAALPTLHLVCDGEFLDDQRGGGECGQW
jgi:hypothetical protein